MEDRCLTVVRIPQLTDPPASSSYFMSDECQYLGCANKSRGFSQHCIYHRAADGIDDMCLIGEESSAGESDRPAAETVSKDTSSKHARSFSSNMEMKDCFDKE
jgi:hypothetical protein